MINFVNKLFGSSSKRHIKSFTKIVDKINEFEEKFKNLSDKELKEKAINPGTSADLIAATLLLYKFKQLLSFNEFQYHEAFSGRH